MKMKKLGSLMLVISMIASVALTGCGASSDSTASTASTAAVSSAASSTVAAETTASGDVDPSTLEPYELNCYFLAPQCKDLPLVQDEVNKILKEKINATIKLNYFWWDSYQDKQRLIVASGDKVDTMFSPAWYGFTNFVAQKAWIPLDELLEKYGQDIKANINPAYLKAPIVNGKLYGIPTGKDMFGVGGVLVNKELADKYKMDFSNVKEPADFEPFLQTIKDNEPGIVPFVTSRGDNVGYFTQDLFDRFIDNTNYVGYKKTDSKDIKVINVLEDEEFSKQIKLSNDWYKKGLINKDAGTLMDSVPVKKAKKAFMWGEQLKPGKDSEMEAQLGLKLIQVNAYQGKQYYVGTGELTNSMLAISRTSKDPARAMMFLNLLFKDKQLKNLLDWGIEGKHYKKIGENQIDYADGVTAETSGYTGLAQWAMGGSQFLDYLWANEATDKWDKMQKFNDSGKPMETLGWTFDQTNVKNEIATLANVGRTYVEPMNDGVADFDKNYPKAKKAMEAAGMQKVIDEAQKQIDAYIASKK